MKLKLNVGDVFSIPISELELGYGQIVKIPNKTTFIIVVFKKKYEAGKSKINLKTICSDEILFEGYTLDALLYHKQWIIIGNYLLNIKKIKLPYYKLGTPPDISITDFEGKFVRKSNSEEFGKLNYLTVVAPIRYELALKAYHKVGEWKDYYSELYYDRVLESIITIENK